MTKRGSSSLAWTVEPRGDVRLELALGKVSHRSCQLAMSQSELGVEGCRVSVGFQLGVERGSARCDLLSSMTPVVLEFLFPPPPPPIA